MDREYYRDYYYYEKSHWWFRVRAKIIEDRIKKIFPDRQNLKILNVGAATGVSSILLEKFGEVTSVEYDRECCDFMKEILHKKVINASILDLPLENESFNLVCAFDVIEHVEDHKTAVKELVRVCKRGGIVFITVPAFMMLWSGHDEVNQHFRRYKPRDIRILFRIHNGKIIFVSCFNFLLFIPILIVRLINKNTIRKRDDKKKYSDLARIRANWTNKLLFHVFFLETIMLRYIIFPFGVSILWLWRKE